MRRLGVIVIVCAGLVAIAQVPGLLVFASVFSHYGSGIHPSALATGLAIVGAVSVLVFGIALIVLRKRLAARWFDDVSIEVSLDGQSLLRLVLILAGLYLLGSALSSIFFTMAGVVLQRAALADSGGPGLLLLLANSLTGLILRALQAALGLILAARSGQIAAWLWRPHKSGVKAPVSSVELASCPSCGASYDPSDYREDCGDRRCTNCKSLLDGDA